MIAKELVDSRKTAFLVIDLQNDYCSENGKIAARNSNVKNIQKIIPTLQNFIKNARKYSVPIIFLRMNKDLQQVKKNLRIKLESLEAPFSESLCVPGTWGFEYYKIDPKKGDVEIIKKTYDGFSNPKLGEFLRRVRIKNLIIVGAYGPVCVDATVKSAFSKGYNVIICEDLVAAPLEMEVEQKVVLNLWKKYFAFVVKSEQIIAIWRKIL